jgi:uncharacterized membrane protein YjjP (DUF1212 family)
MSSTDTLLRLGLTAGELMLRGGAEVCRVEDTVQRILCAVGAEEADVIATPTGIYLTLSLGGELASAVRRVAHTAYDLSLVCAINQFSRSIDINTSPQTALTALESLARHREVYSPRVAAGAAFLAGGSFTVLFGGIAVDSLVGGIGGLLVFLLIGKLGRLGVNRFAVDYCGGALGALNAVLMYLILPTSLQPTVIGSILILVPGVLLTNAVRDSISGDLLSGAARMVEALLVAIAVAAGVGTVLSVWAAFGGLL